ncbi:hypothetical protein GGTG_02231 [Gaeumannomyces tritici R3-111a-1]|uniref:Uncharacterized protein n=1 Tax=Gaeumannomyces tritici (strain R3-111a-1) TaxID=644352 RepID=J3NLT1_GAET3|nr:hypothetical protein GGTG_02231 [Gaeumannomyces tritici R3-111a-1]EJT82257.1 hypothetical protein GGTG_02231 [Gaeumannomyces tritici R3-111a-1]
MQVRETKARHQSSPARRRHSICRRRRSRDFPSSQIAGKRGLGKPNPGARRRPCGGFDLMPGRGGPHDWAAFVGRGGNDRADTLRCHPGRAEQERGGGKEWKGKEWKV